MWNGRYSASLGAIPVLAALLREALNKGEKIQCPICGGLARVKEEYSGDRVVTCSGQCGTVLRLSKGLFKTKVTLVDTNVPEALHLIGQSFKV